jgi:hypothetical protein
LLVAVVAVVNNQTKALVAVAVLVVSVLEAYLLQEEVFQ